MGKAANLVKSRKCLTCGEVFDLSSSGMLKHSRACAEARRVAESLKNIVNRKMPAPAGQE